MDAGQLSPPVEHEPNDRAEDATALQPGVATQGALSSPADVDWYRLQLLSIAPGEFLRIEVSVPVDLEVRALSDGALLWSARTSFVRDLSLHLADKPPPPEIADGGEDAGADGGVDSGVDGGDSRPIHLPEPRGYYLVVKSRAPGAYTLTATVEQGPADIEQEPNDDRAHATAIAGSATGYIAPAGDQDWYRLSADGGILHAELSAGEMAVYAGDKLVAREDGGVVPSVWIPPGDGFIVVRGASDAGMYKLTAALSPDDGSIEREPNNDVASAQTVSLPASIKGWIWPRKDVDVFRFHVAPGHAPVTFVLSEVRGVDLMLRLYELRGASAEVIGTRDSIHEQGEEKLLSVPLKEGDFAVEVSSPRHKDASATESYLLTIR